MPKHDFDKFTAILTKANFDHLTYLIMGDSA